MATAKPTLKPDISFLLRMLRRTMPRLEAAHHIKLSRKSRKVANVDHTCCVIEACPLEGHLRHVLAKSLARGKAFEKPRRVSTSLAADREHPATIGNRESQTYPAELLQ